MRNLNFRTILVDQIQALSLQLNKKDNPVQEVRTLQKDPMLITITLSIEVMILISRLNLKLLWGTNLLFSDPWLCRGFMRKIQLLNSTKKNARELPHMGKKAISNILDYTNLFLITRLLVRWNASVLNRMLQKLLPLWHKLFRFQVEKFQTVEDPLLNLKRVMKTIESQTSEILIIRCYKIWRASQHWQAILTSQ